MKISINSVVFPCMLMEFYFLTSTTDCGELTEPENGLLSLPRGTTYGQTAVFTCKTGYILSGSTQLQCLQDGFWSGTPPTCRLAG
jgi:CUB/sushi domain-containing protein